MAVSTQEVRHIARLARLCLDEDEVECMARDMSSILEFIAVLGGRTLEVEAPDDPPPGGEPAHRAGPGDDLDTTAETRSDPLARPPSRFAPAWKDGFFVVPRLPGVAGRPEQPDASS